MASSNFKVGDLVRKKHGNKPARITHVYYSGCWSCKYVESGGQFTAYEDDLVYYENPAEITMASTLYTFNENGKDIYATVIGKTESGMLVLEARGGGGIFTKSPDDVKEVIPYTVEIRFNGSGIHYESVKGALRKGDVVLNSNGDMGTVVNVDTKAKNARATFKGRRVMTEPVATTPMAVEAAS